MGPLHPLTMGLIPWGFLCSFFRKYILWVLVGVGGSRNFLVVKSMCPVC